MGLMFGKDISMSEKYVSQSRVFNLQTSKKTEINRLANLIYNYAPHDGNFNQLIPGLHINRHSQTDTNWVKAFYLPSILFVAQGVKAFMLGQETIQVGRSCMLMFPVSIPVALQIIKASSHEPFLGVGITLDPEKIAEFVPKVYPRGLPSMKEQSVGCVRETDAGIIDAVARLIECQGNSGDTELLAPIVMDEIIMRLLRSPIGVHIAEMGFVDSRVQHITKAIDWLRNNFSQSMKVENLAKLAHMSTSVFYKHFKAVTSMSPLQYQKALRLQEARHLMLSRQMDAQTACRLVGYISSSQFSRDYSSYFGNPPKRDIMKLHCQVQKSNT